MRPVAPALACARPALGCLALLAASWSVAGLGEQEERSLNQALADDEECRAEAGGPCVVSHLQLHGLRKGGRARDGDSLAAGAGDSDGAKGRRRQRRNRSTVWALAGRAKGDEPHELAFVVPPKDLSQVQATALDLADPASPRYRQWLSLAEANSLMRNAAGLQELAAQLQNLAGASDFREGAGGLLLHATAPVEAWEKLLQSEFHAFRRRSEDADDEGWDDEAQPGGEMSRMLRSTTGFTLPPELQGKVAGILRAEEPPGQVAQRTLGAAAQPPSDAVPPLNVAGPRPFSFDPHIDTDREKESFPSLEALKAKYPFITTPPLLREAYDVGEVAPRGSLMAKEMMKTSQMVYAMLGQHWSQSDRTTFEEAFEIPQDRYVKQLDFGEGSELPESSSTIRGMSSDKLCVDEPRRCLEANLDIQYMMAMSPWSSTGYWYMPGRGAMTFSTFLEEFAEQFANGTAKDGAPQVISISYAVPEFFVTESVSKLFDFSAMRLALRGITILGASGDDGAASTLASMGCDRLLERYGLQVMWPASSPWVTAVGATIGAGTGFDEVVCQVNATGPTAAVYAAMPPTITSGGGYSKKVPRPPWQQAALKGADGAEQGGRGVPDVSLQGAAYAFVTGGRWRYLDGTSAATPTFAGMVSLLNARLVARGQTPIGFLNPLLYGNASSTFNDIVKGDNKCARKGYPCCGGYSAGKGWDAATGLGSPSFSLLADTLSQIAAPTLPGPPLESRIKIA